MYNTFLILIILIFVVPENIRSEKGNRMFLNSTFDPDDVKITKEILINFKDSIPDDSLTIYFNNSDHPEAFSRKIHTAVCADSLCHLVDITFFWEITGKYLGFSLPQGEELTKRDHVAFEESDYFRLNEILSDSSSQLKYHTPDEIQPAKKVVTQTDGITGATPTDISAWVVPGAAYTSYALWHLINGEIRDSIIAYSRNNLLSDPLLVYLLQDKDPYSQITALKWIEETERNSSQFIELALTILHGGNYFASVYALKFLKNTCPENEQFKIAVIQLIDSEDFRIKNAAIEYIREYDNLTHSQAQELIKRLRSGKYYHVNLILNLLDKRYQFDFDDQLKLSMLLNSKDLYVANRAYDFLQNLPNQSPDLTKQLIRYRMKNQP